MDCCVCLETKEPSDLSDRWHADTQTHPVCSTCAPRVQVFCPICRAFPLRDEAPRPILPFREHARGSPLGPLLLDARSVLGPDNLHAGAAVRFDTLDQSAAHLVVYPEFPVPDRTVGLRIVTRLVVHISLLALYIISQSAVQRPDRASDRRRVALVVTASESVVARLLASTPDPFSESNFERMLVDVVREGSEELVGELD